MSQRGMDEYEQHRKQLENVEPEQPPTLIFMDQTPKPSTRRPENKRIRSEISPLSEEVIEDNVTSRMGKVVESTVNELVPKIIQNLKSPLEQLTKPLIHEELETYKKQIMMDFQYEIGTSGRNEHLKMLRQSL